MTSAKKHLTLDEQIDLMISRNLHVEDRVRARKRLLSTSYYRFSGYAREFQYDPRAGGNGFIPGSSFDQISDLVDTDARLRGLLFEALSTIEVGARSAFAHVAGERLGSKAFYLDPASYIDTTPYLDEHVRKFESDLRRPNQPTIERYRDGDDLRDLPIWVAIQCVSFGTFAKTCWYLRDNAVAKETAASLSIQSTGFSATLHAFSTLRNACAHHAQLWNRSFDIAFTLLGKEKKDLPKHKSPGSLPGIVVIKRWLKAMGELGDWGVRVDDLLAQSSEYAHGIYWPKMK